MDYRISAFTGRCATCEKKFEEGTEYFTAVFEGEDKFERTDFCPDCWGAEKSAEARGKCFSFWKSSVPQKDGRRPVLDVEAASDFFRKLAGSEEEHKRNFAYLLALLLLRKKVLLLQDTNYENGTEFMVLRFRREEEDYRVENPGLGADELEKVKDDLGSLMNMDTD